jgi:hypothetical protein
MDEQKARFKEFTRMQWDQLRAALHWPGTDAELMAGLKDLAARHRCGERIFASGPRCDLNIER